MPPLVQKCIKSWKKHLPDYEFKLWNEEAFNINSNEWCKGAYENKKYAFVADYVRLIVLYEHGGIYLDTDEKMEKSLSPFVERDAAFMGFEDGKVLSMGVMGFPPKHHLIAELLEYYNQPFSMDIIRTNVSNAVTATNYLVKRYGLKTNNSEQVIEIYTFIHAHTLMQWISLEIGIDPQILRLYIYIWDHGSPIQKGTNSTVEKHYIGELVNGYGYTLGYNDSKDIS